VRVHLIKETAKTVPKECNWLVGYDLNVKEPVELDNATTFMTKQKAGNFGNWNRNYFLDSYDFADDDWIVYLDDDNIVHPEWYDNIKDLVNEDYAMITWGQVNRDGFKRLDPNPRPKPFGIDTACFMVKWKYAKDVRWDDAPYGDGIYAEKCAAKGEVHCINKYLCYYNYLTNRIHPRVFTFQHMGNHGNIFFQYAAMRHFADIYGGIPRLPEWDGSWHLVQPDFLNSMFKDRIDLTPTTISEYISINEYEDSPYYYKDIQNEWLDDEINNVMLSGYFQDTDLFANYERVRGWFNIPDIPPNSNDLCVNLRIGSDFNLDGHDSRIIHPDSIVAAIENIEYDNLVIIVDANTKSYMDRFAHFEPDVVCRDGIAPNKDFLEIMKYEKLLIANSTFSWWAAFLGNSKTVHVPNDFGSEFDLRTIPGKECVPYDTKFINILTNEKLARHSRLV